MHPFFFILLPFVLLFLTLLFCPLHPTILLPLPSETIIPTTSLFRHPNYSSSPYHHSSSSHTILHLPPDVLPHIRQINFHPTVLPLRPGLILPSTIFTLIFILHLCLLFPNLAILSPQCHPPRLPNINVLPLYPTLLLFPSSSSYH